MWHPPEITLKTKPALAQEMLAAIVKTQRLRCRWVVADEAFGLTTELSGGGGGAGTVVFCRSAPQHAGVGRAPGHPHPRRGMGGDAARSASDWAWGPRRRGR